MLFDFGETEKEKLNNYCDLYKELAKKINGKKHNKVLLLNKALTFQNNVVIEKLPKKVVEYYGFVNKN